MLPDHAKFIQYGCELQHLFFLPLSLLPPTPKATSGCGNQAALEIQRLDFSQSSTPTPSTMQVMGAH